MKYLLSISLFFFLTACGSEEMVDTTVDTPSVEQAPAVEMMPEPEAMPDAVPAMVEYVWHSKEANFSDEALMAHTERWAQIVDEAGWDLNFASVITPQFADDNFDFIWVMIWPTLEARDAAWQSWGETYEAEWLSTSDGIFNYDGSNAFGWTPNPMREPSVENTSATALTGYMFCEYNAGKGPNDLMSAGEQFNAWVDSYEEANGPGSYWWAIMTPQFELPEGTNVDYAWFNSWADESERAAGNAAFAESGLAGTFAEIATCQDEAMFDSRAIYVADTM